jgi:hypothetical protein
LGNFSSGVAVISQDKKWGVIDKTGRIMIQPQYEMAFSKNGLTVVQLESKWGYVDAKGKYVWAPTE